MSGSDDNDATSTDSQGETSVSGPAGRLRNPGGGTTDFERSERPERREVDQLTDRFRKANSASEVTGSSLEERSDVEGEEVDDFEIEDELLDALDRESNAVDSSGPSKLVDTNEGIGESESPRTDTRQADQDSDGAEPAPTQDIEPGTGNTCPSCGATSPEGMRFCVQCGQKLADAGSAAEREPSGRPEAKESNQGEAPAADVPADATVPPGMKLVMINDDGTDGDVIDIDTPVTTLGRNADHSFPKDDFLDEEHSRLVVDDGALHIEDLNSLNGTYLKLRGEVTLREGDTFLMGRQVLRFEPIDADLDGTNRAEDGTRYMGSPAPGGEHRLVQIGIGNVVQDVYCLPKDSVVLGREKGDITFPGDKFMSGRHARIIIEDGCHLVDLNSSNGTWIKLWERTELDEDDYIFMGQQLFRVELPG
jgi:pSer/pThr/pTyr-binding forkhead associated (FHA) protein